MLTFFTISAYITGTKKGITLKEVDGKTINENITEEAPQTDSTNIKFVIFKTKFILQLKDL